MKFRINTTGSIVEPNDETVLEQMKNSPFYTAIPDVEPDAQEGDNEGVKLSLIHISTMPTRSWVSAGRTAKSTSLRKYTSSRRTPKKLSAWPVRQRLTRALKCSAILRSQTGSGHGRRPASAPIP